MVEFNDRRQHEGQSHLTCPRCKPLIKEAERFANAKMRKVYGKVTPKARVEAAQNKRYSNQLYAQAFKEHRAAIPLERNGSE